MSYLRHPPLAFWALTLIVLLTVTGVAARYGGQHPLRPHVAANADAQQARQTVLQLRDQANEMVSLAANPDERLHAWGRANAQLATQAADRRTALGISPDDTLTKELRAYAQQAAAMQTVALNPDAARAEAETLLVMLDQMLVLALDDGAPAPLYTPPAANTTSPSPTAGS